MSNPHDVSEQDLVACDMSKFAIACPACGSRNTVAKIEQHRYHPIGGTEHGCEFPVIHCQECNEEFRTKEADQIVREMVDAADFQAGNSMLDALKAKGLQLPYIQRALRLGSIPEVNWRCFASKEQIALLRIVTYFPWILQVADSNYNPEVIDVIMKSLAKKVQ